MSTANKYIIIAFVFLFCFTGLVFFSMWEQYGGQKKPIVEEIGNETSGDWYIKFTVTNQTATAYTEAVNATVSASGENYYLGTVAVHPSYPGGSPLEPIIPFGTEIFLFEPIEINGKNYSSFKIIDTGDINYRLWGDSPYWLDIYFGQTNSYNTKQAKDYGVQKVDYYWYEPWK